MKYSDAKKLHNGDEVIDKKTGESVKVLSISVRLANPRSVMIEGVGAKSGYYKAGWTHLEIK